MKSVIEINQLSKAYQLGEFSTGTLSRDLERWIYMIMGKQDPFLKIGEENIQFKSNHSNIVWSLKDINLSINEGEAVGILGKNGAGKSTLLKILSRVTGPTSGQIKMKGRVASLLEVGTGFHPELTGRENIYLNGAILGMKTHEIKRNFDEILSFSGVEKYVDTPVKRYSSGMYVRLAFAVAAHLESEILIVDEVLAVGDFNFRKKCLGKMKDMNNSKSKTVLFVSHDISSIKALCSTAFCLENGKIAIEGPTEEVAHFYMNSDSDIKLISSKILDFDIKIPGFLDFVEFSFVDANNSSMNTNVLYRDADYYIKITFNLLKLEPSLIMMVSFYSDDGTLLFCSETNDNGDFDFSLLNIGLNEFFLKLPISKFSWGKSYYVELSCALHHVGWIIPPNNETKIKFECLNKIQISSYHSDTRYGYMFENINWKRHF
jgi:lipopolysaccharide transport system ATP-binding protein